VRGCDARRLPAPSSASFLNGLSAVSILSRTPGRREIACTPYPFPVNRPAFPIDELLPRIRESLAAHPRLVLEAPPGAGKTTQVPPALLDAPWLAGRKIVMLEPRRVAARAAAQFMAKQRGEDAGGAVGYRIRFENKVSAATRIEVVTEGILTRMIQDDPRSMASAHCCSTNSTSATSPPISALRSRSTCRLRCAKTCASW